MNYLSDDSYVHQLIVYVKCPQCKFTPRYTFGIDFLSACNAPDEQISEAALFVWNHVYQTYCSSCHTVQLYPTVVQLFDSLKDIGSTCNQ